MIIAATLFSILAGPAQETLPQYTQAAQIQVLYGYDDVRGITTHAVHGDMDYQTALALMIQGTRLQIGWMDGDTATLTVAPAVNEFYSVGTTEPCRIAGHDYTCVPLGWVIGMATNRLGRLLYDMGVVSHDTLFATNERPIDPSRYPERDDAADEILISSPRARARTHTPSWGPRAR